MYELGIRAFLPSYLYNPLVNRHMYETFQSYPETKLCNLVTRGMELEYKTLGTELLLEMTENRLLNNLQCLATETNSCGILKGKKSSNKRTMKHETSLIL